jgi:glucokinase
MHESNGCWVGFDLGGTKMLAVVYDSNFKALGLSRKKTKGHEGKKAGLERMVAVVEEAMQEASVKREDLRAIGIGCPGPLDLKRGIIHEAPNLGWKHVAVRDTLQDEFHCPTVVSNDVDAGVFGEYKFGAGQGANCVVGVFPGTGIGGGCVYQGQLIQGANCTAMEIGHIPIMPQGPLDGAGNAGTLEALASRLAISSAAAAAAYRGHAPCLMDAVGTDIASIRSGALAKSMKEDPAVRQILEQATQHLSLGVVTLVHLLAPDVIVLGGGLVEAMPEFFVKSVSKAVRERVLPAYRDVFKVLPAALGDDAAVLGAAAWAREQLLKNS